MIQIFDPGALRSLLSFFPTVCALSVVAVLLVSYSGLVGGSIRRNMPARAPAMPDSEEAIADRNWPR